jgi:hypothetical protein
MLLILAECNLTPPKKILQVKYWDPLESHAPDPTFEQRQGSGCDPGWVGLHLVLEPEPEGSKSREPPLEGDRKSRREVASGF